MLYWIKTSAFVKHLFPRYHWSGPVADKTVYLTFDDGPIPVITPWVLDQLRRYNAKATFFCIGDNVIKHGEILGEIIADGHSVGNHTQNHLNGWSTSTVKYIDNAAQCMQALAERSVKTLLFRPPYGKIRSSAARLLMAKGYKIIMWDVLSADFDQSISREKCLKNVVENIASGSIIIFHDSEKAFKNLEYALPQTLKFLAEQNYKCKSLS